MRVPGRLNGWCSRVTAGKTPCGWLGCRRGQSTRQRFSDAAMSLGTTHCQRDQPDAKIRCAMIAPHHAFVMQLDAALPPIFCASSAPCIFIPGVRRAAIVAPIHGPIVHSATGRPAIDRRRP